MYLFTSKWFCLLLSVLFFYFSVIFLDEEVNNDRFLVARMKFRQLFDIFKYDHDCPDEQFISFQQLYTFLKDKDKNIQNSKVRRAFQSNGSGIKEINGKESVTVKSVLKYSFNNEKSVACRFIANVVQNEILKQNEATTNVSSSHELYKLIAKTQFHNVDIVQLQSSAVDETQIDSIITDHKSQFTEEEWAKIVWFENHFSKSYDSTACDYEDVVSQKYSKFQSLLSIKEVSNHLHNIVNKDIKTREKRLDNAAELNNVELKAREKHLAHVLDSDILSLIHEYTDNVKYVVSFDTSISKQKNTTQVAFSINTTNLPYELQDFCTRIYYQILRKHKLHIECVYVFNEQDLNPFFSECRPSRFRLRDLIQTQNVNGLVYTWVMQEDIDELDETESENGAADQCEACYKVSKLNPLTNNGFNVVQEWIFEVPIEVQILLEVFINKKSLRSAPNRQVFVQKKLQKVHTIYDQLLNVYNRNYIGVQQKANTNELMVEYKSISSVFDITSASGTSCSLRRAEYDVKKLADEDLCYYNTFLKDYPLYYASLTGPIEKRISLRDCHCILMLDNLVRFSFLRNKARDEKSSNQLPTLPITLQGMPTDSQITRHWHNEDCDGTEQCQCKQPLKLDKGDVNRSLLQLSSREKDSRDNFSQLMTWSSALLWRNITDEIMEHIDDTDMTETTLDGDTADETMLKNTVEDITDETEEDIDLCSVLEVFDCKKTIEKNDADSSEDELEKTITCEKVSSHFEDSVMDMFSDDTVTDISEIGQSVENISLLDTDHSIQSDDVDLPDMLKLFGFSKFQVPPLLCRHPPPAVGRDDDKMKIKEILDDVLMKLGYTTENTSSLNRILCGPDNKIGKCLLELMETDNKYKMLLPEFPLLHLRKSKITVLFSAYQDAGLVQLMKFMKDDSEEDWRKLVSVQHIDTATKYVKRIAQSLNLALLVTFLKTLAKDDQEMLINDMETEQPVTLATNWSSRFNRFVDETSRINATFALHLDILKHCNHVIQIAFAERLGGQGGYSLLLAAVKESLCFSFVNNASSYAPYCVKLLHQHYSAGFFHTCLKETLFSTPFKGSKHNFACDTKRELDHIEAIKAFRSGSNIKAVTCRMSLVDALNDARLKHLDDASCENGAKHDDNLGWKITKIDESYIFPTAAMILRQGGLSTESSDIPYNVYSKIPKILPISILDSQSYDTGKFLLMRFLVKERMFGLTQNDMPVTDGITDPSELVSRARRSKGVTIKRTVKSRVVAAKSESEVKEIKRQKFVSRELRLIDCYSSLNNNCQALVKPDSSKPKVMKSVGMRRALKTIITECKGEDSLICIGQSHLPNTISTDVSVCAVEFAGVKFKIGNISTGKDYIQFVEMVLKRLLNQMPNIQKLIVCEEKYSFTPDEFKAGTRSQRTTKHNQEMTIDHLKTAADIVNDEQLNKDAATKTLLGKKAISNFLAANVDKLQFDGKFQLIVDSELHVQKCQCQNDPCSCELYCTPITCTYSDSESRSRGELLQTVKQKKGEAEMAVVDWLINSQDELNPGQAAVSVVSSGDIDAVYIHLFAISRMWKRDENHQFVNPVYVVLQKPAGKLDIYNITGMLSLFERYYCDINIGTTLSVGLCVGGNDFIPKLYQISHEKILKLLTSKPWLRLNLCHRHNGNIVLNQDCLVLLYKSLYCPKKYCCDNLTFENVRAISIGKQPDTSAKGGYNTNDPRKWLPPESAVRRLGELLQLQVTYLQSAGNHESKGPEVLQSQTLRHTSSGETEYDFGSESRFQTFEELPVFQPPLSKMKKRQQTTTPQKGRRRKKIVTSTPYSSK